MNINELYSTKGLSKKLLEIREEAANDFYTFICLVAPHLELGSCHEEAARFLSNLEETHKLLIYPRACLKSKLLSLYVVWRIVRDPTVTILYASATAALAEAQLFSIKSYLSSDVISKLYPELMNRVEEGKRDKWSQSAINVEHPLRKKLNIRDNTVYAVGAGKNITGLHFDVLALDDIIAPNTDVDPWTTSGREKASRWVSLATSILNPGGEVVGAGTIYHSKDIYYELMDIKEPIFDEENNTIDEIPLYSVLKKPIEENGEFLWPRRKGKDGKYYGFDEKVLARIKASYIDKAIFYSQYYNNPNDPENKKIDSNLFQYYDKSNLINYENRWVLNGDELTIYAALDMAMTITKRSDYTALVIVGVDNNNYRYILDIDRIKTDRISVMTDLILNKYSKWRFLKLRAEVNQAQGLVAKQIKETCVMHGAVFAWDFKTSRTDKELRIVSILEPLYQQNLIFHYKGGNTEFLEAELIQAKPDHDDVSDALAMCMEIIPFNFKRSTKNKKNSNVVYHPLYGGVI